MKSIFKEHSLYQEDLQNILSTKGIDQIRNKAFLITGATGLIGACLIDALMLFNSQGADILIYAVGRSRENASSRLGEYFNNEFFHFIEHDVRFPFSEKQDVDYIIPLASNTHPVLYSQYPVETLETVVRGAEYALQKAVQCGATVLYPSTVEVYGNARGDDIFNEEYTGVLDLSTSRSCYTEAKRLAEALCQSYVAEMNAKVKIARLCRIFGPTALESDSKASSQFLSKALMSDDIVLKSNGEQLYSYAYVADAVSALLHILINGDNGQAYNISVDTCNVQLKDFAAICAEWAGKEVLFQLPPTVEKNGYSIATRAVLDNSKLKGIGWKSETGIKDAIFKTLDIISSSL